MSTYTETDTSIAGDGNSCNDNGDIHKSNKSTTASIESQKPCVFINSNDPTSPNQVINSASNQIFKPEFPPKFKPQDLLSVGDGNNSSSINDDNNGINSNSVNDKVPSRAPNAFIIYRKACVKTAHSKGYHLPMTIVSSMASQSWKEESQDVKNEYKRLANEVNTYHKQIYPKSPKRRKRKQWNIVSFDNCHSLSSSTDSKKINNVSGSDSRPHSNPSSSIPSPSSISSPSKKKSKPSSFLFKSIEPLDNNNNNKTKKIRRKIFKDNKDNNNNIIINKVTSSLSLINNDDGDNDGDFLYRQNFIKSNHAIDTMAPIIPIKSSFPSSSSSSSPPPPSSSSSPPPSPPPSSIKNINKVIYPSPVNHDFNLEGKDAAIETNCHSENNYELNEMNKSIYPSPEIPSDGFVTNNYNINKNNINGDYNCNYDDLRYDQHYIGDNDNNATTIISDVNIANGNSGCWNDRYQLWHNDIIEEPSSNIILSNNFVVDDAFGIYY